MTQASPTSSIKRSQQNLTQLAIQADKIRDRELELLPRVARRAAALFDALPRPRVTTDQLEAEHRGREFVMLRSTLTADPGETVGYRRILALGRDGNVYVMRADVGPPSHVRTYRPERSSVSASSVLESLHDALSETEKSLRNRENRASSLTGTLRTLP